MTGVSLPTAFEKEELEKAVTDGFNQVSDGCADQFQRWMYNATLVEQKLHQDMVLTDKTTRLQNTFEGTSTLVVQFATKISCNGCSEIEAFASSYPTTFGRRPQALLGNKNGNRNRRQLFNDDEEYGTGSAKIRGEDNSLIGIESRNLPEMSSNRLDAGEILLAIEKAARDVRPDLQGFLEVTIVARGDDGSTTATTMIKEKENGEQYSPSFFRDEALARAQDFDCDNGAATKKKRKKSSKYDDYYGSKSSKGSDYSTKSEKAKSWKSWGTKSTTDSSKVAQTNKSKKKSGGKTKSTKAPTAKSGKSKTTKAPTTKSSKTTKAPTTKSSKTSKAPTTKSGSKESKAPTTKSGSKVSKAPTTKSGSKVSKAPTTKSGSKVSKTPTTKSGSKVSKAPTTKSGSKESKAPTTKSGSKVSKAPTTKSGSKESKAPTTKSGSKVSKAPTTKSGSKESKAPTTKGGSKGSKASTTKSAKALNGKSQKSSSAMARCSELDDGDPLVPPRTTNPPCNVCGAGKKVTSPNSNFEWEGQGPTQCAALELAGTNGLIEGDICPDLPELIADACGCA